MRPCSKHYTHTHTQTHKQKGARQSQHTNSHRKVSVHICMLRCVVSRTSPVGDGFGVGCKMQDPGATIHNRSESTERRTWMLSFLVSRTPSYPACVRLHFLGTSQLGEPGGWANQAVTEELLGSGLDARKKLFTGSPSVRHADTSRVIENVSVEDDTKLVPNPLNGQKYFKLQ